MRVVCLLVALVVAMPTTVSADPFRELDLIRPSREKQAPEFSVAGLRGERVALRELRGTVVFLNFWATWCLPCEQEMPAMERLYRRYKARGLTMVAISLDADPARVVPDFVKRLGLTFPIGLDPKRDAANRYGIRALPSTFLIGRDGRTAAFALGPRDWDSAAAHAVIEALLK